MGSTPEGVVRSRCSCPVLATGRSATPLWPRFVTQGLHRSLAALSVFMLVAHVVSAVVDSYVDIRWWQAFVPFGSTYEPVWLALGAISLDLLAVVVATSLARASVPHRVWFLVHLSHLRRLGVGRGARPVHRYRLRGGLDGGDHRQLRRGGRVAVFARVVAVLNGKRANRRRHRNDGPRRPYGPQSGVERAERHGSRVPAESGSGRGAS